MATTEFRVAAARIVLTGYIVLNLLFLVDDLVARKFHLAAMVGTTALSAAYTLHFVGRFEALRKPRNVIPAFGLIALLTALLVWP